VPKTTRSRVIPADAKMIWDVVSDPYHLSRWWPKVTRIEGVQERKRGSGTLWTKVLETQAGRSIRADFRCLYSKEPTAYAWEQEVEGSPFERVFRSSKTSINLSEAEEGTRVTLEADQRLRGLSRLGGFMVRRATGRQLDDALEGLAQAIAGEREVAEAPDA
jgi:carbon monoxide dehydrogenase subunit G